MREKTPIEKVRERLEILEELEMLETEFSLIKNEYEGMKKRLQGRLAELD